jgi:hypothetical protein
MLVSASTGAAALPGSRAGLRDAQRRDGLLAERARLLQLLLLLELAQRLLALGPKDTAGLT